MGTIGHRIHVQYTLVCFTNSACEGKPCEVNDTFFDAVTFDSLGIVMCTELDTCSVINRCPPLLVRLSECSGPTWEAHSFTNYRQAHMGQHLGSIVSRRDM